jgi:hypothetical protein
MISYTFLCYLVSILSYIFNIFRFITIKATPNICGEWFQKGVVHSTISSFTRILYPV